MTFTHSDVEERLVDFVGGEIDAEARAAFEAHLATCERCRDEVSALAGARGAARQVVRSGLGDPIPAALHARVMDAARTAVAARAAITVPAGLAAPAPVTAVARPPDAHARGWMAWLRARWTLPLFATVAAMGVLLLGRETVFREARRPIGGEVPVETSPALPEGPAKGGPRDNSAAAPGAPAPTTPGRDLVPGEPSEMRGVLAEAERKESAKRQPTGAPGESPPARKKSAARSRTAPPVGAARQLPAEREARVDSQDGLLDGVAPSGGMRAKPNADDRAPAVRPAAAPEIADRPLAGASASASERARARSGTTSESTPRSPLSSRERRLEKSEIADVEEGQPPTTPAGPSSPASDVLDSSAGAASSTGKTADDATLAARGQKLMAASRWSDAIAVYRELLQRFPRHPSASAWRRQISRARAQSENLGAGSRFAKPPPPR